MSAADRRGIGRRPDRMGTDPPTECDRHGRTRTGTWILGAAGTAASGPRLVVLPDPEHVPAEDLADDLVGVAALDHADGEQGPVGP